MIEYKKPNCKTSELRICSGVEFVNAKKLKTLKIKDYGMAVLCSKEFSFIGNSFRNEKCKERKLKMALLHLAAVFIQEEEFVRPITNTCKESHF